MTFLKKGCHFILACFMLLSISHSSVIPAQAVEADPAVYIAENNGNTHAAALSEEKIIEKIQSSYRAAKAASGRSSFYNRCSQLVNWTTVVLGIQNERYNCNGNAEYNMYENLTKTECGYTVNKYPASEYSLESAMNVMSDDGTRDVYNIIIGWQSGSSYASRRYGHTCFIHAISDGMVYFYESYGLEIGGRHYNEGEPIVCTIEDFANYYDGWARFEGAVQFGNPDTSAPVLSQIQVLNVTEDGFYLRFCVTDDTAVTDAYAKVWTYGNSEEEGYQVFPFHVENGIAIARIDTADFGGFTGRYYARCFASDRTGNTASAVLAKGEGVDLCVADADKGVCRVIQDDTGVYNAPYVSINGADTLEYTLDADTKLVIIGNIVTDVGEIWYQLEDGCWINSASVKRMNNVMAYIDSAIANVMPASE